METLGGTKPEEVFNLDFAEYVMQLNSSGWDTG